MSRQYARISDPQLSDLPLIWDSSNSDWRLCTLNDILTLFQGSLVFPDAGRPEPNTQYAAPSATGFDIQIGDGVGLPYNEDIHLILTPAATYADGAITLPPSGSVRDKQIVILNTTQQVTTFVVNGNGASGVYGAPTSLAADSFLTLKYDATMNSWYRIG